LGQPLIQQYLPQGQPRNAEAYVKKSLKNAAMRISIEAKTGLPASTTFRWKGMGYSTKMTDDEKFGFGKEQVRRQYHRQLDAFTIRHFLKCCRKIRKGTSNRQLRTVIANLAKKHHTPIPTAPRGFGARLDDRWKRWLLQELEIAAGDFRKAVLKIEDEECLQRERRARARKKKTNVKRVGRA
jgi:hypothetical protein